MALQILGTGPDPEKVAAQIVAAVEAAIPGARAEATPGSAGHFEIRVVSETFTGQSRVKQQQTVYKAITHLLQGANPPIHAIDRMECVTP